MIGRAVTLVDESFCKIRERGRSNSSFDSFGDGMCLTVRADSYDTITNIKAEALALLHCVLILDAFM